MDWILNEVLRLIDRMGTQEWLYVLTGVVVAGLVFLRGFGSRSGY